MRALLLSLLLGLPVSGLAGDDHERIESLVPEDLSAREVRKLAGRRYPSKRIVREVVERLTEVGNMRLHDEQDPDGARAFLGTAVALARKQLGERHRITAGALLDLGVLERDLEEEDEAKKHLFEALDLLEEMHGKDHPRLVHALEALGEQYAEEGRDGEALKMFQRVLPIVERTRGPHHPDVGNLLLGIARAAREAGDLETAEATARRALALIEKAAPAMEQPNFLYVESLRLLADILIGVGKAEEAAGLRERRLAEEKRLGF